MSSFQDIVNNKIIQKYNYYPFEGGNKRFKLISRGERKGSISSNVGKSKSAMLIMRLSDIDSFRWDDSQSVRGIYVFRSYINRIPVKYVHYNNKLTIVKEK
jgi:hypothetical protein